MDLNYIKKLATWEGFSDFVIRMKPANRFVAAYIVILLFLALIRLVFDPGHRDFQSVKAENETVKTEALAEEVQEREEVKEGRPYYTRPIVRWSEPEFSDLNDVQLVAAKKNGLKDCIATREDAEKLVEKGGLVFVGASPLFYLDDLSHSIPYLVPKAHRLMNRIALNFMDSLKSKKVPVHKLIVTSVLRTESDVNRLKHSNVNATTQSCHYYGTTVDISYNRFKELEKDPMETHDAVRAVLMKRTLGEVLRDLRYEGRCYVKHEAKQGCFHITVR